MKHPIKLALVLATCFTPACISPGCFLKPTQAFDAASLAAQPDYTDPDSWAALPDKQDKADLTPPGFEDKQATAPADVFFVYPTVWFSREIWNDTFDSPKSNEMVDEIILSGQASAFNECCKVYVPRYRQATLGTFYAEDPAQQNKALQTAYDDIDRAFDTFLQTHNKNRPFILAGHSQGSMHLMRLLERVNQDEALRSRMVAAYIPGFSHPAARFETAYPNLSPCGTPDQTGCVAAWDTYREGAATTGDDPLVYWIDGTPQKFPDDDPRLCVNPISWRSDNTPSRTDDHLGAVLPDNQGNPIKFSRLIFSEDPIGTDIRGLQAPRSRFITATCVDGFLRVPDVEPLNYPVQETEPGNYHLLDYELFWADIRANATLRVTTWLTQHPTTDTPAPAPQ